jgi:hypothetical protein
MAARNPTQARHASIGGAVAGLVAGAVMSVFMLFVNVLRGGDVWTVFKGASAPFFGARASVPGFDPAPVLTGLLTHFAVSICWGVLFGLVFYGLSKGLTVAMGAVWGVVVWFGMFYIVLPLVGLGEMARHAPPGIAIFQHVVFGLAVACAFLPFQHEAARFPFVHRGGRRPSFG